MPVIGAFQNILRAFEGKCSASRDALQVARSFSSKTGSEQLIYWLLYKIETNFQRLHQYILGVQLHIFTRTNIIIVAKQNIQHVNNNIIYYCLRKLID